MQNTHCFFSKSSVEFCYCFQFLCQIPASLKWRTPHFAVQDPFPAVVIFWSQEKIKVVIFNTMLASLRSERRREPHLCYLCCYQYHSLSESPLATLNQLTRIKWKGIVVCWHNRCLFTAFNCVTGWNQRHLTSVVFQGSIRRGWPNN